MSALTRRHPVLLPREAADENMVLAARAPYRVEPPDAIVQLLHDLPGELDISLLGYSGSFPSVTLWSRRGLDYRGRVSIALDLSTGEIRVGETVVDRIQMPLPGRRFAWEFNYRPRGKPALRGITGHYLPPASQLVGESYYHGEDYVDYGAQAEGEAERIVELLREHGGRSPVLEVGAATGVILGQIREAGFDATGIDFSEWAVETARTRLGQSSVFLVDVEKDELPSEVVARGPFEVLLLWAVLEHFREPFRVLEKLSRHVAAGGLLMINTTNSASLSHRIFGEDWEGYFDWTHHGVDSLSPHTLRTELPKLGWTIESLYTHLFWHSGAHPEHAVLRDAFAYDARFRTLLRNRELGDMLVCVARRAGTTTPTV